MSKTKKIYWLVNGSASPLYKGKALLLLSHGYEVQFFGSVSQFKDHFLKSRTGIIFIADNGPEIDIKEMVVQVVSMPETQGARFILTLENDLSQLMEITATLCFRDMIPMHLEDNLWIQRVLFSCASKALPFVQPNAQITMNNIATVELPARITWIGDERLRLECRFRPPIGATLKLKGEISKLLGIDKINIKVEENHRNRLHYRFSDALVASWDIPPTAINKFQNLLWNLRKSHKTPLYRAFVAIKTSSIRTIILQNLDRPDFNVKSALQTQSIEAEPKYFTPDIVFIEDELTANAHEQRFRNMLESIPDYIPIVLVGNNYGVTDLKSKYPNKRLLVLNRIPQNFEKAVLDKLIPDISKDRSEHDFGAAVLPLNHHLTSVLVSVPARIIQIHPQVCKIAIPYKTGNFGLVKLNSPLIKKCIDKDIWLKITDVEKSDKNYFSYAFEALYQNLSEQDQIAMANFISEMVTSHYDKLKHESKELNAVHNPVNIEELDTTNIEPNIPPEVIHNPHLHVKEIYKEQATNSIPIVGDIVLNSNKAKSEPEDLEIISIDDFQEISDKAKSVVSNIYKDVSSKSFKNAVKFFVIIGFLISIVISIFYLIESRSPSHSGKAFTDSLYKYAPHMKKAPQPFVRPDREKKEDE